MSALAFSASPYPVLVSILNSTLRHRLEPAASQRHAQNSLLTNEHVLITYAASISKCVKPFNVPYRRTDIVETISTQGCAIAWKTAANMRCAIRCYPSVECFIIAAQLYIFKSAWISCSGL